MTSFSLIEDLNQFYHENQHLRKDRNIAILEFNIRLLDFANQVETPTMEKLNFAHIIFKNIDEFVSIRLAEIPSETRHIYINFINSIYRHLNDIVEKTISAYDYRGLSIPSEPETKTKDGRIFYAYQTSNGQCHMVRFAGNKPEFIEKVRIYANNDPGVDTGFFVRFLSDKSFRYVYYGEEVTDLIEEIEKMVEIKSKEVFNYVQCSTEDIDQCNNFMKQLGIRLDSSMYVEESLMFIEYIAADMKEKIKSDSAYYSKAAPKYTQYNYIEELKKRDILISNPFDDYRHVTDFINQCCTCEVTRLIFISLYRVAADSIITDSLIEAADAGKHVYVFIEPTARGNEEANLELVMKLSAHNIHIEYNYFRYKVHSKVFTAITQDGTSYSYIGTGNFNENTAKVYTDMHLLTTSMDIGARLFEIARSLSTKMAIPPYDVEKSRVLMSPLNFKKQILSMIEGESRKGPNGRIIIKCNNLCDTHIIDALYYAADKGVTIQVICRTSCALHPKENITIKSKVGRYLQHDRFYVFGDRIFIGSADLLLRNLSKRIEVACELTDDASKKKVIDIFNSIWNCPDIHHMNTDGSWDWDIE